MGDNYSKIYDDIYTLKTNNRITRTIKLDTARNRGNLSAYY